MNNNNTTEAEKAVLLKPDIFSDVLHECVRSMQGELREQFLMNLIGEAMTHLEDKGASFAAQIIDNAIQDGAKLTDLFSRDDFVGMVSEMVANQDWRRS